MARAEDIAAVLDLEKRRIDAVNAGDADAIALLFAEEIIQVHGNGKIDDKASLMAGERLARRTIEPRDVQVRLYGDVAILTGPAVQHIMIKGEPATIRLFITQVAARKEGTWRFVSAQATLLPEG